MKKLICLTLVLLLALLSACGGGETVYNITVNGKTCTVDTGAQTVTCGDEVCRYSISGGSSRTQVKITYPDGATYSSSINRGGAFTSTASGWSDDYREENYAMPGDDLVDALMEGRSDRNRLGGGWFLGLLAIALGIWNVVSPRSAWYLAYGWRYRNAEPSEAALFFARVGGVAAILAGIVLFFV